MFSMLMEELYQYNFMALSQQVEDSLREAQSHLRNALAYAARTEKSYISMHIGKMMHNIDSLIDVHELLERVEDREKGDKGRWGPIIGDFDLG